MFQPCKGDVFYEADVGTLVLCQPAQSGYGLIRSVSKINGQHPRLDTG